MTRREVRTRTAHQGGSSTRISLLARKQVGGMSCDWDGLDARRARETVPLDSRSDAPAVHPLSLRAGKAAAGTLEVSLGKYIHASDAGRVRGLVHCACTVYIADRGPLAMLLHPRIQRRWGTMSARPCARRERSLKVSPLTVRCMCIQVREPASRQRRVMYVEGSRGCALSCRVARVVRGPVVVVRECDGRSGTRHVSPCEREVLGGVEQCAGESHSGVFWEGV